MNFSWIHAWLLINCVHLLGHGSHRAEQAAVRFQTHFTDHQERHHKLTLVSSSQSISEGFIRSMTLRFSIVRALELAEARCFYIDLLDNYLEEINRDIRLRTFLCPYPFTPHQVDIELVFVDVHGCFLDPRYIALIFKKADNTLFYATFNPITGHLEELFCEPLAEARIQIALDREHRQRELLCP